jgi:hypothetical protein
VVQLEGKEQWRVDFSGDLSPESVASALVYLVPVTHVFDVVDPSLWRRTLRVRPSAQSPTGVPLVCDVDWSKIGPDVNFIARDGSPLRWCGYKSKPQLGGGAFGSDQWYTSSSRYDDWRALSQAEIGAITGPSARAWHESLLERPKEATTPTPLPEKQFSWDLVPPHITHVAQDKSGSWYGYAGCPLLSEHQWLLPRRSTVVVSVGSPFGVIPKPEDPVGGWSKSLKVRPSEVFDIDWRKVPADVGWIARDANGDWLGYSSPVEWREENRGWIPPILDAHVTRADQWITGNPAGGRHMDSLRRREDLEWHDIAWDKVHPDITWAARDSCGWWCGYTCGAPVVAGSTFETPPGSTLRSLRPSLGHVLGNPKAGDWMLSAHIRPRVAEVTSPTGTWNVAADGATTPKVTVVDSQSIKVIWDKLPATINYVARDADGWWFGYPTKPTPDTSRLEWRPADGFDTRIRGISYPDCPVGGCGGLVDAIPIATRYLKSWTDTLVARPVTVRWDKVPTYINYVARDSDGTWYGYCGRPLLTPAGALYPGYSGGWEDPAGAGHEGPRKIDPEVELLGGYHDHVWSSRLFKRQ